MSVASVESIPDRFNALYDYEVLHMPKTQIAKSDMICSKKRFAGSFFDTHSAVE